MNFRDLQNARQSLCELLMLADEAMRMISRHGGEVTCYGSQEGEDAIIEKLFAEVSEPACYVDVGACWPVECSNTWKLYEKGWRGLLIEPNPGAVCALSIGRPGDQIRGVANSNYRGVGRLVVQSSTTHLLGEAEIEGRAGLMVPVEPLSYTLGLYPDIASRCRFVSIDVEGREKEVLEGIDWATFHPDVFCVEHRTVYQGYTEEDSSKRWEGILLEHGYEQVWKTNCNTIYSSGLGIKKVEPNL